MKMNKWMKLSVGLLAGVAMMASLTACGGGSSTTAEQPAATEQPAAEASTDASAEAKTISFAHVSAEDTSTNAAALKFKEYVEANSNGLLKVDVYPNGQLGGDRELIENTQNGSITAMLSSPAPQVNFVKAATIFDAPFVFKDLDHARAVLNDEQFIAALGTEYEAAGFHYFGASGQGFRTLTSNKKVTSLADLKGFSIRTMENKFHMKAWSLLGANPTPLTFNELYTALQQGTVDAQENPIELVYSQKFYEQQKYIMDTNHILQTNTWIMNKDFYDGLSDDLKAVVDEAAKEAIAVANQVNDEKQPEYIKTIQDYGCEFVEIPAEEKAKIAEAVKPVYDDIKEATTEDVYNTFFSAVEQYKK